LGEFALEELAGRFTRTLRAVEDSDDAKAGAYFEVSEALPTDARYSTIVLTFSDGMERAYTITEVSAPGASAGSRIHVRERSGFAIEAWVMTFRSHPQQTLQNPKIFKPFHQTFSEDDGKTWSGLVLLEEGSVCPDLAPMSSGLLACSYGRPSGCLMFSADGGKTWNSHHVITAKTGFTYSGIVQVRPGRLFYVHEAGGLQALTIDVERLAH